MLRHSARMFATAVRKAPTLALKTVEKSNSNTPNNTRKFPQLFGTDPAFHEDLYMKGNAIYTNVAPEETTDNTPHSQYSYRPK